MDSLSDMTLFNSANSFVVKKNNSYIYISKSLLSNITKSNEYTENQRGTRVMGLLGVLNGKNANYLLVINRVTEVGAILGNRVYKINEILLVNFIGDGSLTSEEDKHYDRMIKDFVARNSLYFCNEYDLTNPVSRLFNRSQTGGNPRTPFSNINRNFCWNYEIGKNYDNANLLSVLIPVINGAIGISVNSYNVSNKSREFSFILISRKDTRRSGMRFLVRGADSNGNVANFTETEQILTTAGEDPNDTNLLSYMQIRGSIPVSWKQEPDLYLNPDVIYIINV